MYKRYIIKNNKRRFKYLNTSHIKLIHPHIDAVISIPPSDSIELDRDKRIASCRDKRLLKLPSLCSKEGDLVVPSLSADSIFGVDCFNGGGVCDVKAVRYLRRNVRGMSSNKSEVPSFKSRLS